MGVIRESQRLRQEHLHRVSLLSRNLLPLPFLGMVLSLLQLPCGLVIVRFHVPHCSTLLILGRCSASTCSLSASSAFFSAACASFPSRVMGERRVGWSLVTLLVVLVCFFLLSAPQSRGDHREHRVSVPCGAALLLLPALDICCHSRTCVVWLVLCADPMSVSHRETWCQWMDRLNVLTSSPSSPPMRNCR